MTEETLNGYVNKIQSFNMNEDKRFDAVHIKDAVMAGYNICRSECEKGDLEVAIRIGALEKENAELEETNADLKQSLDWANERESEDIKCITDLEKENAELKKENRLLKSLLYCTTRSCNNCGKVTCENFQRQRIDCCGNWVSYKDYIKQLKAQIEKMKCCENCAKRGHICVAEEMQGNLCGKNKDKWELRR